MINSKLYNILKAPENMGKNTNNDQASSSTMLSSGETLNIGFNLNPLHN